jgi:hydrogenase maturation protein HypF
VAGIILDGTGLGPDGTIWGGEVLLGDYLGFDRRAWLKPAPLAGGDRAAREPWRNALVRLDQAGLSDWADRLFAEKPCMVLRQAVAKGINAPLSSSAGRLFDAVAAIAGLCEDTQTFEGEAAMLLEAMGGLIHVEPSATAMSDLGPEIDPGPLLECLVRSLMLDPAETAAAMFHADLAQAFALRVRALVDSGQARAVALSGGCFQNALLHRLVVQALGDVPVLVHRVTPANDGGLALGQAVVAAARALQGPESR